MNKFYSILLLLIFCVSCFSGSKVTTTNYASIYSSSHNNLNPHFKIYHNSDSTSQVYFVINSDEILFPKKPNSEFHECDIIMRYKLLSSLEEKIVLDSGILSIVQRNDENQKLVYGDFEVKTGELEYAVLQIDVGDMSCKKKFKQFLEIDKKDGSSDQFYLLKDKSGIPVLSANLACCENLKIEFSNPDIDKLYGKLYTQDFPLALPPFSVYDYKPTRLTVDTIFELNKINGNFELPSFSQTFFVAKQGVFRVSIDTATLAKGCSMMRYSKSFPGLGKLDELIPPLRYITTKKEYNDLLSVHTRDAMDEFWMKLNSNPQKANGLFKSYYRRVKDANDYFTSYMEGWKTDRGMIYIVFGAPNIIYKSRYSENWIYGEENNFMSLNFVFKKVENPLSNNDYSLNRSSIYKSSYYKAVDSWRQGRILN